jgi:hypothetical protein
LPIREIEYRFHLPNDLPRPADPKRFEVVAHRSSPRILIFDFHANNLLSVKMMQWELMDQKPLVIRRKPGSEVRVPFRPVPGATLLYPKNDLRGITVDPEKGDLVITDPEPGRLEPVSEFTVEATSPNGIKTHFPFPIPSAEGQETSE